MLRSINNYIRAFFKYVLSQWAALKELLLAAFKLKTPSPSHYQPISDVGSRWALLRDLKDREPI
jgi:hypothetical protein